MGDKKYYITKSQIDKINELARFENEHDIKKLLDDVEKKQEVKK
jgi:hypothetical protein